MMIIVIGLAIADIITGLLKANVTEGYSSKAMRKGGLNKIGEVVIMATAIGLELGIHKLGEFYELEIFGGIAGTLAATSVFVYIVIMELISILENFAEANPDAPWAKLLAKKLRAVEKDKEREIGADELENTEETETDEENKESESDD